MNMTKCYYNLNIGNINILRHDWTFPDLTNHKLNQVFYDRTEKIFKKEFVQQFDDYGVSLGDLTMIFYRKPGQYQATAHIDYTHNSTPNIFGINYVIGGIDSNMVWYNLPEKETEVSTKQTDINYKEFHIDDLVEVERHNIRKLTLVRTDLPHAILSGQQERWCISLRIKRKDIGKFKDWDSIVAHMRQYGLLIER